MANKNDKQTDAHEEQKQHDRPNTSHNGDTDEHTPGGDASSLNSSLLDRVRSTELLAESPAENSEYDAHRNIARSLRYSILEDAESRFIALLGGLGTGKSTVIRLMESDDILDSDVLPTSDTESEDKEMLLFTFDAWTHAGESLRRSFVQELIEWLRTQESVTATMHKGNSKKKKKDQQLWAYEEDRVVRRITERKTTSGTSPSIFGILFVLLTIALSTSLNSAFESEAGQFDSLWETFSTDPYALISTIIVLIFISFIVTLSGPQPTQNDPHPSKLDLTDNGSEKRHNFFRLVDRRTNTTTTTAADRQTPSSYDVREALRTIFRDVLQNTNRKLVVVVDNIDRLTGAPEIKAALSLIQLLFDIRSDGTERTHWVNQFWLIAPFSEQALFEAMSNELGEQTPRHLIDKPFQVQVTIPSPLYTGWRNHLKKSLNRALRETSVTGGHSENCKPDCETVQDPDEDPQALTNETGQITPDNIDTIVELVANEAPKQSHLPKSKRGTLRVGRINQRITRRPRDIKRFVNDLVMLYRTRGVEKIPLPVLAYYVVRQIELDGSELLTTVLRNSRDELLLPARLIGIAPDVLLDHMYMLDYGVDASDAGEYRLMDELEEAFREGETMSRAGIKLADKAISRYQNKTDEDTTNKVKTILSDATQNIRTRPRMRLLIKYALVVQGLNQPNTITNELLRDFDTIIANAEELDIKHSDPSEIARYVNNRPEKNRDELTVHILLNLGQITLGSEDQGSISWEEWAAFASELLLHLNSEWRELPTGLVVPGDPHEYLQIVRSVLDVNSIDAFELLMLSRRFIWPSQFSIADSKVKQQIEAFVTPRFEYQSTDIESLTTVPVAVHLIQSAKSDDIYAWTWGQVVQDTMVFLNEVSSVPDRKNGLVLPETLAVMLALTQKRTTFWVSHSSEAHTLLFRMLGDSRVQPLEPKILAAAFVFCGMRDVSLKNTLVFSEVDPEHDASTNAKTQILNAPDNENIGRLIRELCDLLDIGLDDFSPDYKPLVTHLF